MPAGRPYPFRLHRLRGRDRKGRRLQPCHHRFQLRLPRGGRHERRFQLYLVPLSVRVSTSRTTSGRDGIAHERPVPRAVEVRVIAPRERAGSEQRGEAGCR